VSLYGQIGQKRLDFRTVQIFGMLLVVEEDKTFNPIEISLFGSIGIMLGAKGLADLIEQLRGWRWHQMIS
jgi:hypothetical protein